MLRFIIPRAIVRLTAIITVKVETKDIYSSRSYTSTSGNGHGDKLDESLNSVLELALQSRGAEHTAQLLEKFASQLRSVPRPTATMATPYVNTIPVEAQTPYPGDWKLERRIKSLMRWNAMAMVVKANSTTNVGGHIASFASSATLYDIDTVLYVQVLSCPYSHVSSFAARPFICTETLRAPGRHWCSTSMYC